ncbi:sugar nucleotide-binding protein [Lactobacillus delbrueckii subsp. bulgaricus]
MTDYYTSGEFAKRAHVSVRTIRYYDQQNLLKPSARSKGGARRYSDADFAKLQQILLLKYLGFSLGEIRGLTLGASDQIGTPTYTLDLARLLVDMIETDKYGYYHATNAELPETASGYDENGTKTGYISWYDFTKEIYRQAGYKTKVTPVTTEEYGLSKAVRPFNSRLDKSKLEKNGFKPLPTWPDAVHRYLEALKADGFFD